MICVHCGCGYEAYECCGQHEHACRECHDELVHGVVTDQNIHQCGNTHTTPIDDDSDMYGRSDSSLEGDE